MLWADKLHWHCKEKRRSQLGILVDLGDPWARGPEAVELLVVEVVLLGTTSCGLKMRARADKGVEEVGARRHVGGDAWGRRGYGGEKARRALNYIFPLHRGACLSVPVHGNRAAQFLRSHKKLPRILLSEKQTFD